METNLPEAKTLRRINSIVRYTLAFVFIYHGLVPKVLWLSPVEAALANAHNLDANTLYPFLGFVEIGFGLSIIIFSYIAVPLTFRTVSFDD